MLLPVYVDWNNDPDGGAWTGYEDLIDQMATGVMDVEGPGVDARTPEHRVALRYLHAMARRHGYIAHRPEPHGLAAKWFRFEREQ
jgi:hypothetical protein